eukprot:13108231-Alexandrium_andersonii.AAC.1
MLQTGVGGSKANPARLLQEGLVGEVALVAASAPPLRNLLGLTGEPGHELASSMGALHCRRMPLPA